MVLIALLTVAACSGKPAEAPVEPDAPETEKVVAVTIEYWHINNETFGLPAIRQLIEEFNATNGKNITVVEKFILMFILALHKTCRRHLLRGFIQALFK